MKTRILIITLMLLLTSCATGTVQTPPTPALSDIVPTGEVEEPVSTDIPQVGMANPASVYCVEQGYKSEIRTATDGSQSGVCIFSDGSECDEWAFFRSECGLSQPVTDTPVVPMQTVASPSDMIIPQAVPIPVGVIVDPRNGATGMTGSLVFYTSDGLTLGEISAPYADKLHAAGAYQGVLNFPLVFHSFDTENRQQSLRVNKDGQVVDVLSLNENSILSNLVGVPRETMILYAIFQPADSNLQTQIFLGNVDSLPTAAPILTLESAESRYWKPVAIQVKDGAPKGIWFTRSPWGIGGDIVFIYHEGLSYLDLATGTIYEALTTDATFSSLSADQTWITYTVRGDGGSGLFIRNLTGGDPILIPSLPESDRGAGDGIFSPSNKYVVWREARGSLMDGTFHETIRVATLDGQAVNDFPDTMFYDVLQPQAVSTSKIPFPQFGEGTQISPAGWLDDETFLVQAITPEKPHGGALIKVNAVTGGMTFFAYGDFTGWFYP